MNMKYDANNYHQFLILFQVTLSIPDFILFSSLFL